MSRAFSRAIMELQGKGTLASEKYGAIYKVCCFHLIHPRAYAHDSSKQLPYLMMAIFSLIKCLKAQANTFSTDPLRRQQMCSLSIGTGCHILFYSHCNRRSFDMYCCYWNSWSHSWRCWTCCQRKFELPCCMFQMDSPTRSAASQSW